MPAWLHAADANKLLLPRVAQLLQAHLPSPAGHPFAQQVPGLPRPTCSRQGRPDCRRLWQRHPRAHRAGGRHGARPRGPHPRRWRLAGGGAGGQGEREVTKKRQGMSEACACLCWTEVMHALLWRAHRSCHVLEGHHVAG